MFTSTIIRLFVLTLLVEVFCAGADDIAGLAKLSKAPYLELRDRLIASTNELGEPADISELVAREAIAIRRSHPDAHKELRALEGLYPVNRADIRAWLSLVESKLPARTALFLFSEVLLFDTIDLTVRTGNPEEDNSSNIWGENFRRGFWSDIYKSARQSTELTDEQKDDLVIALNARFSYEAFLSWINKYLLTREFGRALDILRRLEPRKVGFGTFFKVVGLLHNFHRSPALVESSKQNMVKFRHLEVEAHAFIIEKLELTLPGDRAIAEALTTSLVDGCEDIMDYEAMLGIDLLPGLVAQVQARWEKEGDQAQVARLQATRQRMKGHTPDPKRFIKEVPSP